MFCRTKQIVDGDAAKPGGHVKHFGALSSTLRFELKQQLLGASGRTQTMTKRPVVELRHDSSHTVHSFLCLNTKHQNGQNTVDFLVHTDVTTYTLHRLQSTNNRMLQSLHSYFDGKGRVATSTFVPSPLQPVPAP